MKKAWALLVLVALLLSTTAYASEFGESQEDYVKSTYGVNHPITGDYNVSLAVQCSNGTFIGKEHDNVLAFKGIPYAIQPTGGAPGETLRGGRGRGRRL